MTELDFRTARLFKVLGNPLRYKLLLELAREPRTPSELARLTRRCRPAVSRDLHLLHWAGIVHYRTCGHHVFYAVKHPEILRLLDTGRGFIHRFELPVPPASEAPPVPA
jgi:DNA-binding transcriptional ArsR family regulator